MKKILFYGSLKKEDLEEVTSFLKVLIPKLLERDFQIITREGTADEASQKIWLDNLVLDIACDYRDKHDLNYESVISLRLDNKAPSNHKRKIITLNSSDRFQGYKEILEKCDVIISLGGTGGVYRLGLVAAATNHFFIPLSIVAGDSQILARQLNEYLTNRYSDKLSDFILENEIRSDEIEKFINIIISGLNKPKDKVEDVSDEQFVNYIENHIDKLKKLKIKSLGKILINLPVSWIISLCGLILAVIVLFILQIILQ